MPEIGFVSITTTGAITFSVGKPEEIRALRWACLTKGFKVAPNLKPTR